MVRTCITERRVVLVFFRFFIVFLQCRKSTSILLFDDTTTSSTSIRAYNSAFNILYIHIQKPTKTKGNQKKIVS
jgi:hypothetical protein